MAFAASLYTTESYATSNDTTHPMINQRGIGVIITILTIPTGIRLVLSANRITIVTQRYNQ